MDKVVKTKRRIKITPGIGFLLGLGVGILGYETLVIPDEVNQATEQAVHETLDGMVVGNVTLRGGASVSSEIHAGLADFIGREGDVFYFTRQVDLRLTPQGYDYGCISTQDPDIKNYNTLLEDRGWIER